MGKSYFYGETWGNHATSVSDGLSGRIVAVSGSDPGSTFRYPGSIEVRLFDIRCAPSFTFAFFSPSSQLMMSSSTAAAAVWR